MSVFCFISEISLIIILVKNEDNALVALNIDPTLTIG